MMIRRFLTGCLLALLICDAQAQTKAKAKPPKEHEITKMEAAIVNKPSAKPGKRRLLPFLPRKSRKLLVFSVSPGYYHSSIPYGKKIAEIMAKKTGAFEVVVSDDISMFEPETLKQFDAIWFNNTNNEMFMPENFNKLSAEEKKAAVERDERLKKSLVDFISGGKGLAVTHAGLASFRKWPEYGNIIGGRFDNHPWHAGSTVTLKVDDPKHPVAQAFKEPVFVVQDEIYQVKGPYSRDKCHVLLSIDTTKTDMKKRGIHRKDNDFAISWVKPYGKGRVFYCELGHMHHIFWNPVVMQHYLDGIQYVLGDLE